MTDEDRRLASSSGTGAPAGRAAHAESIAMQVGAARRRPLTWRLLVSVGAVAIALLSGGCGTARVSSGGATSPSTRAVSTPALASCLDGSTAHAVTLAGPSDAVVALLGHSPEAVVLSNESDEDLCSWAAFATTLMDHGYEVAMYNYGPCLLSPTQCLTAVVTYLRAHGSGRIALLGASEGAKVSIITGATLQPAPDAVVTLSAEAYLVGTAVAPFAADLRAPTLYISASEDAYGATAATRGYYTASPATAKHLLIVPGTAHGTQLLTDPSTVTAILTFLAATIALPGAGR